MPIFKFQDLYKAVIIHFYQKYVFLVKKNKPWQYIFKQTIDLSGIYIIREEIQKDLTIMW